MPITFLFYWLVLGKKRKYQNLFLLVASYFFYGFWDWRFLSLIVISSGADFAISQLIHDSTNAKNRKKLLFLSVFINIGVLCAFKYYNFFVENLSAMVSAFGFNLSLVTANIVLPVGISFYTFQTLGYTLDVYKRRIEPERNWVSFFGFVAFFPQLVAGPIEKAKSLIPQFNQPRKFDYESGKQGLEMVLWGLFMKVVISGICAVEADYVYGEYMRLSSPQLLMGQFFFMIQLYCDFAGYSLVAIGVAKLFGFHLSANFNYPYFSRSMQEFWTRWHITLNKWFGDYVFTPMIKMYGNTPLRVWLIYLFTFFLIGLWHGPNWTYILTFVGFSVYFIPRILFNSKKRYSVFPTMKDVGHIFLLDLIIYFHLIFFRSDTVKDAVVFIERIFLAGRWNWIEKAPISKFIPLLVVFVFLAIEWRTRKVPYPFFNNKWPTLLRWSVYCFLAVLVATYIDNTQPYIYFQF
ncbi:MBOAT family O-acyltransferase [Limnoraphis robusta CCNP1315]|uniref:MBOAT family O-acyltransferase n=1 Tax=Limnoraphis robusta CCNP1315 TaxID=3110306 RepID=A0ABU5U7W5_9CYAN|nr:MBOAT family O-acyltransferase [Limnoraphis robusta]MEA5522208.1 MBOAT family O-acyltransferase [Limnoraphis robusta CCNP1315]